MKRILFCFILLLAILPSVVAAQTTTPTPSTSQSTPPSQSTVEKLSQQINQLKDRIASRVAQMNLVEKHGIIGTVSTASATKITITDIQGNDRIVDVDEITKFSSPDVKGSFGISDMTAGIRVSVLGIYNKESRHILARFVDATTPPVFISGQINDIDRVNYTITVKSEDQKTHLIDIENTTKSSSYTDADNIQRLGFSKVKLNDRVHIVGYANKKDPNRTSALRILVLSDMPTNPKIPAANGETIPSPTPSKATTRTTPTQ